MRSVLSALTSQCKTYFALFQGCFSLFFGDRLSMRFLKFLSNHKSIHALHNTFANHGPIGRGGGDLQNILDTMKSKNQIRYVIAK